jgi:hypothetical protein
MTIFDVAALAGGSAEMDRPQTDPQDGELGAVVEKLLPR